jgi:hypothetical protein
MERHEEQELLSKVAVIYERVDSLPCRTNNGCGWNLKQKAVAGTGLTGGIAAIILTLYTYIAGGK